VDLMDLIQQLNQPKVVMQNMKMVQTVKDLIYQMQLPMVQLHIKNV
jgi:hypothetical protein